MPVRHSLLKPEDELVGDKVAAEILGLYNFRTLSNWRSDGRNPDLPYVRIGRSIRYRIGDLIEFRQRHTIGGVTAVEPVIEQVAAASSTLAKAPTPTSVNTTAAIDIALGSTEVQQVRQQVIEPVAPVHIIRPSDLVRRQLNI
jgi:hypothetical protein